MDITIKINLDNATFGEDPRWQLNDILNEVIELVPPLEPGESVELYDNDGNTVGSIDITP